MQPNLIHLYDLKAMDATNQSKFIGFGAMHATETYNCMGRGAMDAAKPYTFLWLGALDATETYKCLGLGAIDVPKPYKFHKFWGHGCNQALINFYVLGHGCHQALYLGPWMPPNPINLYGLGYGCSQTL